jgi:hypothetical protein
MIALANPANRDSINTSTLFFNTLFPMLRLFRRPPSFSDRLRSLIPRLTEGDKKDLSQSYRLLRGSFIGYVHYDLWYGALLSSLSGSFDFPSLLSQSLFNGLDLILHPLLDVTGVIIFKPPINKLRVWIPWTATTSIISSLVIRSLKIASRNGYIHGRLSLDGFSANLLPYVSHRVGFATSVGLARYFLPDAAQIGGTFAHELAAIGIGALGGTSFEWIARGCPVNYSNVLATYVRDLPRLGLQSMYYVGNVGKLLPKLL